MPDRGSQQVWEPGVNSVAGTKVAGRYWVLSVLCGPLGYTIVWTQHSYRNRQLG